MFETRIAVAQASGAGDNAFTAWKTGAAANAATAIIGYVRSLDITSAYTVHPVMGGLGANYVGHFKNAGVQPITVNMTLDFTGAIHELSAYNASVPMGMIEIMHKQAGTNVSAYWHLFGVAWNPSQQFTVNAQANTITLQTQALGMLKTGSGYIMT